MTVRAGGKKFRADSYGVNSLADALCEPHKETHPYTYSTADNKGWREKLVALDADLAAHPASSSVKVRTIFCMEEPY